MRPGEVVRVSECQRLLLLSFQSADHLSIGRIPCWPTCIMWVYLFDPLCVHSPPIPSPLPVCNVLSWPALLMRPTPIPVPAGASLRSHLPACMPASLPQRLSQLTPHLVAGRHTIVQRAALAGECCQLESRSRAVCCPECKPTMRMTTNGLCLPSEPLLLYPAGLTAPPTVVMPPQVYSPITPVVSTLALCFSCIGIVHVVRLDDGLCPDPSGSVHKGCRWPPRLRPHLRSLGSTCGDILAQDIYHLIGTSTKQEYSFLSKYFIFYYILHIFLYFDIILLTLCVRRGSRENIVRLD